MVLIQQEPQAVLVNSPSEITFTFTAVFGLSKYLPLYVQAHWARWIWTMPFLKRSRSQLVRNVTPTNGPDEGREGSENALSVAQLRHNDSDEPVTKTNRHQGRFENRRSILGRAKSTDTPRRINTIIDRPRTANRISEVDEDWEMPCRSLLAPEGETIAIQSGGDIYRFPTPSPRLPPQSSRTTPLGSSHLAASPGWSTPVGASRGFPAKPPPQRSYTSDHVATLDQRPILGDRALTALPQNPPSAHEVQANGRKKRPSWKALGALFGRKSAKPPVPDSFYKPQNNPNSMSPAARLYAQGNSNSVLNTSASPKPSLEGLHVTASPTLQPSRSPSLHRGMMRAEVRAHGDRQSFMPNVEAKTTRSPSGLGRELSTAQAKPLEVIQDEASLVSIAKDIPKKVPGRANGQTPQPVPDAVPRTPKLDTNIPDGGLDRYSVMFEKLLEPRRQSILERRQEKARKVPLSSCRKELPATPESLPSTTYTGLVPVANSVPKRSFTSPHLTRVPSLTIRTNSMQSRQAPQPKAVEVTIRRPATRSSTMPSFLSPTPPASSQPPKSSTIMASDLTASPDSSVICGENSLPPTPTSIATTTADHDGVTVLLHDPMPTVRHQPSGNGSEMTWALLGNNNNNNRSTDFIPAIPPAKKPLLRARNQPHISAQYPRVKSPADLERQIVQVSVARQVSVSRARRVVEKAHESKQPLRPRVVDLTAAQVWSRKSTYVCIESGEE
ncbi:hypothetical protein LTR62_004168 [Meristemomyces frigidus]|uniref:Uncharacterized protein n=1 Tax=Meristemomyces frigidus TaxID=1508187 RepID=A0AAN7TIH2_9PEZI|nr:hypothetical protein LTR62_004168 [Meristemomyces frigidus]